MPKYDMVCEKCGHEEEIMKMISSPFPTNCPKCKSKKYSQNFTKRFGETNIVIDYCGEAKEVKQQGERNYKKLSQEQKDKIDRKKPKGKKPLWERMKNWKWN